MLTQTVLKLFYLGDRDYVNGLTLVEESLKYFFSYMKIDDLSNVVLRMYKVMKFIRTDARLEISYQSDKEQRLKIRDSAGQIEIEVGDDSYRLLLFSMNFESKPIIKPEYDRAVYVKTDNHNVDGSTEAVLQNIKNSYDLLRGIVEVNQRFSVLHTPRMDLPKCKYWAYMTNYKLLNPAQLSKEIEISFTLGTVVRQPDRTLIIRNVLVPILERENEIILCFFN